MHPCLTLESLTPHGGSQSLIGEWKCDVYREVYTTGSCLNVEALPTTARSFDVGVVKHKLAGEFCLDKIHFCAQQGQLSLLLNENSHTCGGSEKENTHLEHEQSWSLAAGNSVIVCDRGKERRPST